MKQNQCSSFSERTSVDCIERNTVNTIILNTLKEVIGLLAMIVRPARRLQEHQENIIV